MRTGGRRARHDPDRDADPSVSFDVASDWNAEVTGADPVEATVSGKIAG